MKSLGRVLVAGCTEVDGALSVGGSEVDEAVDCVDASGLDIVIQTEVEIQERARTRMWLR